MLPEPICNLKPVNIQKYTDYEQKMELFPDKASFCF